MEFTFFEINGDPLNGGPLRVGTSGQAVVEDDDGFLQPDTEDTGAQFSINGVDFTSTAYPDYSGTGTNVEIYSATVRIGGVNQTVTFAYLTAAGDSVDDNVNRIVQLSGPTLSSNMRLRNINLDSGNTNVEYTSIPSIICFTPGAMITTPRGQIPVEMLQIGDLVITADNGLQAIRWIGRKRMTGARLQAYPKLRPIRIRKDAFGDGLPDRDMWVSPQHRMLISSQRALLEHGEREVLAPAKGLLNDYSVTVDYGIRETEYIHILFDRHEIVFANGAPTESFHPGMTAMSAIDNDARTELFEVFPELETEPARYGPSARFSLRVQEAESLHDQELPSLNL
ncbi:MAG: Hint domain-containing protein [Rhodobacteraceae bacterium]|nr:Hint domain-containing protein [Paracoccaceae bacterium]